MRLRTYLFVALALLAAAGAAAGSLLAIGGGSDVARTPTGAETVVRVQPLEDTVACGKAPAVAYIYLDDLQFRASPNKPSVAYGLAAFQVLLSYDPDIVRIAQPIDVQLNPALDSMDADGDGLARSFAPAMNIDDYAGRALLGAFSVGPGIDVTGGETSPGRDPALNFEEGIDPVAQGEPVLLLTVGFLTVGQGTTKLSLSTPPGEPAELGTLLLDPDGKPYEPVVLREATLTVKGGDCPPAPPATPRPTAVPTPAPPTPTPVVVPTPRLVTPVPAEEAGRADCPQGWSAYTDPDGHFSICYPSDWEASTSRPSGRGAVGVTISSNVAVGTPVAGQPRGHIVMTAWWQGPEARAAMIDSQCGRFGDVWAVPVEKLTIQISGATATACRAMGTSENVDEGTLEVLVLDPGGGVVEVFAHPAAAELHGAEILAGQVLATLKVPGT